MKITVLVDNHAQEGLVTEHGLAIWVETGEMEILFDTGQGPALPANAARLGISLHRAKSLVLSHGHYDHTGGLPYVCAQNPGIQVYCHPGVLQPCYRLLEDGMAKVIDMPDEARDALAMIPEGQLHWTNQPMLISPRIGVTGPIGRATPYEDTGGPFFFDCEGEAENPIEEDQSMWIASPQGLIVVTGCCHSGLVNTLRHIQTITRERRIRAIIGGFHLLNASENRLQSTLAELQALNPELIAPCHCTGGQVFPLLLEAFGNRAKVGSAGMSLAF